MGGQWKWERPSRNQITQRRGRTSHERRAHLPELRPRRGPQWRLFQMPELRREFGLLLSQERRGEPAGETAPRPFYFWRLRDKNLPPNIFIIFSCNCLV